MAKKCIILPDFIIIGANKAGTTSVANYLNMHPNIKISTVKEPMFFNSLPSQISQTKDNANLEKPYFALDLDEYSSMFETKDKKIKLYGEASTAYLANPVRSAILMKKIVPDVKIIVILREPTQRAISAYKMCYGNKIEDRPFDEIASNAKNELKILDNHGVKEYIRNGLYSQLLEPYSLYFNSNKILLLNYEKLVQTPRQFMGKIFEFLKVKSENIDYTKKYNEANEHTRKRKTTITNESIEKLDLAFKEDLKILETKYNFTFN
jgi:hypothetical protein